MAKCPFCTKELTYLDAFTESRARFDGENYEDLTMSELADTEYECPHCGVVLTDDEDEARGLITRKPKIRKRRYSIRRVERHLKPTDR